MEGIVLRKITPFLANGFPKTCWGCGKPFVIRRGHAEAVVGHDDRLYCYRKGCEEVALIPQVLGPAAYGREAGLI